MDYLDYADNVSYSLTASGHEEAEMSTAEMTTAQYLKATEVATMLHMDVSSIYKLCASKVIPSIRVGEKAVRIPRAGLDAYLAKQAGAAVGQGRALLDEARSTAGAPSDALHRQADSFASRAGCSPHEYVDQWRAGEITDSPASADLLIEALGLRSALDRIHEPQGMLA